MPRYYIYDANGILFGSPKGYDRYCTAQGICTRYRHKLWAIYDNKPVKTTNLMWSIKLENK